MKNTGHGANAAPAFALEVDGSTQYLGVRVPPGGHPLRAEALDLLKAGGFRLDALSRVWRLHGRHEVLLFLASHGGALRTRFNARFAPEFQQRTARVCAASLVAEARVVETPGVKKDARPPAPQAELTVRVTAPGADEATIRAALLRGQPYVEAPDGRIILFPRDVLEAASAVARAFSPGGGSGRSDAPAARISRRVRPEEFADMENLLAANAAAFAPPGQWRERSAALRSISALREAPVPPACYAQLRLYQKIGTAWLWHLGTHGLGGVLADEMGLGKTVQALAFLAALHATRPGASSLVACPASLLENWRREALRFAEGVPLFIHHGAGRATDAGALPPAGIFITSYGTLARDAELLASRHWDAVLADEAQHAKNRHSVNAQSLRALPAGARFALTGTPVENSVDDLRSLFEFLMPGYIARPPAACGRDARAFMDARAIEQAAPYVLRRSKTAVAPELPPKIEQTIFVPLEGGQHRLYEEFRARSQREIFEMEMAGASDGALRMHALGHLLRLRQICAEPRLLAPELAPEDSAKLRAFREILDEARDGGHRILVFSQFVEVLGHLRAALNEWETPCCYLDGSTRDRQTVCDQFNHDESIPVFLISLKAGGVGLNLTGADTVLHYDPWWNPAAEAQATDRAHRIGQTRRVTSLRLIAASTVEERVIELQRKKAALLQALFDGAETADSPLRLDLLKDLLG
ncbi:MAG: DEAD/DEAH box helicase [Puniceicoccales bacterium]|nr:DEAD/DEAH box helicase [Puniceicoccales bacterium]